MDQIPGYSLHADGVDILDDQARSYVKFIADTTPLIPDGPDPLAVTVLGHGFNNRLYYVSTGICELVLKVYPLAGNDRMLREYSALSLLESVDSVPRPVWAESNARFLSRPALLCERVAGITLSEVPISARDCDHLARHLETVRKFRPPVDGPLAESVGPLSPSMCLDYIDRTTNALGYTMETRGAAFRDRLDELKEHRRCLELLELGREASSEPVRGFCQGDCRPDNMIRDEESGALKFVDWEHAGMMDPAYEAASFLSRPETLQLPGSQRDLFIEEYVSLSKDPSLRVRIYTYLTILPVQWTARILGLISDEDATRTQPWVTPRTEEQLFDDLEVYQEVARQVLSGELLD